MNRNAGLLAAWAYLAIAVVVIGAVSGVALWYKGAIDAGWNAKITEANAKIKTLEDAAKVQIEKSNTVIEVRYVKIQPEVDAVKLAEGCARQPLPDDAIAVLRSLGLLADADKPADKPGAGAGSAATTN